jgi:hypothetical protein
VKELAIAAIVLSASLIAGLAGAGPSAEPLAAPGSMRAQVMALLEDGMAQAGLDQLPPTALVNGHEVPIAEALALLAWADMPAPRATALVLPTKDVGTGAVLPGSPPCTPGAIALAALLGIGTPQHAFTFSSDQLQAGPVCHLTVEGFTLDIDTWLGDATGRVNGGSQLALACLIGSWAVAHTPCHAGDFQAVSFVGHVAQVDLLLQFPFSIYIDIGVVAGGSPDYPNVVGTLA